MNIKSSVAYAVGAALLSGAVPVAAQEIARGSDLEEIVVTARKRVETIQEAPLSIQAFNAEQIEQRGITNFADLAKFSAGLNFNSGTYRGSSSITIRGMNQVNPVGDNRRDLVTVFLDGVPLLGSPATYGVEDLERVEIVKGPQSALFGRATFGGAISMISSTPGDEFKGQVSATAATYDDYRGSMSVEGPLIPSILSGRFAIAANDFNGFYKNSLGGRLGETKGLVYSGVLNFTPSESFDLKVRYSDRNDTDGPEATPLIARFTEHNCGPFPGFQTRSLAGLPPSFTTVGQARRAYCGPLKAPSGPIAINITPPANIIAQVPFKDSQAKLDQSLLSGTAEYRFSDGHSINAVVSTQDYTFRRLADFERAPEDRYWSYSNITQEQDSYELRLTSPAEYRFKYMVGVARLETTYDTSGGFINGTLFGATQGGPPVAGLTPARNLSKTDSVFGSIGYDITDRFNVSVEARYQDDTILSGVGLPTQFAVTTKATLPRVLAKYKVTDETNVYVNYAKGNQPTQGYSTFFQITPAQQTVALANGISPTAPEAKVENYELGLKHRSADGAWFLNGSVYYLKWVGRQGVRTVQVDLNGDGIIQTGAAPNGETFNTVPFAAGDSNTKGIEVDGAFALTDLITIGGSASYADTKITKALNESLPLRFFGLTDAKGFKFGQVAPFTGAVYANYEAPMSGDLTWFVRGDLTYRDRMWDSIVNLAYVPTQVRVGLRGGLRAENWDLTLFVKNLFNDKTLESSRYQSDSATDPFFFQLASSEAVLPNKRQGGITVTYRF